MHGRILCVAALASILSGCHRSQSSTITATAPTTQSSREDWRRYDDPRFSAQEQQAVRAATNAVLDPKRPRPNFDQTFRYIVSKDHGDWMVMVWYVHGFKNEKPQFVPDGYTSVILDKNFKVKSTMPGG
jgi:hypothetical protein